MTRLARYILVAFTVVTVFVTSLLSGDGRVLCVGAAGHMAVEAAHAETGCPEAHEGPGPSESHGPSDCCHDVSADVELARETSPCPLESHFDLHLLPPVGGDSVASASLTEAAISRFDVALHPPAGGDLARLGGIVLLI